VAKRTTRSREDGNGTGKNPPKGKLGVCGSLSRCLLGQHRSPEEHQLERWESIAQSIGANCQIDFLDVV
jgi:hypothetical protein